MQADSQKTQEALEAFEQGKLVAIPTETVYGLAAPINNNALIEKIFELKERPFFDPLIVHVSDQEQAKSLTTAWCETAELLAQHFWPGPLSIVLPKSEAVSDLITSGLSSLAIRCPDHALSLKFIKELGCPLAAPSANKFSKTSPTNVEHVAKAFSREDVYILDGGPCQLGIESTIVSIEDGALRILRPGMITASNFLELGIELLKDESSKNQSTPGSMKDHYMPESPLFLTQNQSSEEIDKALLELGITSYHTIELSDSALLAARNLYRVLHEKNAQEALVFQVKAAYQEDEKWLSILDRLEKASSGWLN